MPQHAYRGACITARVSRHAGFDGRFKAGAGPRCASLLDWTAVFSEFAHGHSSVTTRSGTAVSTATGRSSSCSNMRPPAASWFAPSLFSVAGCLGLDRLSTTVRAGIRGERKHTGTPRGSNLRRQAAGPCGASYGIVSHGIALRSTTLHYMTLPYVASPRVASRHSTSPLPSLACLVPLAWRTRCRLPSKADFRVF